MNYFPVVIAAPNMTELGRYSLPIVVDAFRRLGQEVVVLTATEPDDVQLATHIADGKKLQMHWPLLRELMTLRWADKHPGPFAMVDWDELPFVSFAHLYQRFCTNYDFVYRATGVPVFLRSAKPLHEFWHWMHVEWKKQQSDKLWNEMLLWHAFRADSGLTYANINDALAGAYFYGGNLAVAEGCEVEAAAREDGRHYQRIFWHGTTPFICRPPQQLIPMAVAHCWGIYKKRINELALRADLMEI